jgi:CRP/FNR family transcriptional regulator
MMLQKPKVTDLKAIPFFAKLETSVLEALSRCSYIKNFSAKEILYYEKDEDDYLYFIIEGGIKFYKVDRFDNEVFLYHLSSNRLVFDTAKFFDEHHFVCYANAEFTVDSKLLCLESRAFRKIMNSTPSLMKRVLQESFEAISRLQCIISRDVVFDGIAKVAHMINSDLEHFNRLKKHEIAYMLHIQPETLSRILKKLERNKIILIEKNCVIVQDYEALRKIYE